MSKIIEKTATACDLQNEIVERSKAVSEVNRKINLLQNNLKQTKEKLATDILDQVNEIIADIKNEQEKLNDEQFKLARVFQYLKDNGNLKPTFFKTNTGVFINYFDGIQIKTILVSENIPKIFNYRIIKEDSHKIIFKKLFKEYHLNKIEDVVEEIK